MAVNFSKKLLAAPVTTRNVQKKTFFGTGSNVSDNNSLFDDDDSMNMSTDSPQQQRGRSPQKVQAINLKQIKEEDDEQLITPR